MAGRARRAATTCGAGISRVTNIVVPHGVFPRDPALRPLASASVANAVWPLVRCETRGHTAQIDCPSVERRGMNRWSPCRTIRSAHRSSRRPVTVPRRARSAGKRRQGIPVSLRPRRVELSHSPVEKAAVHRRARIVVLYRPARAVERRGFSRRGARTDWNCRRWLRGERTRLRPPGPNRWRSVRSAKIRLARGRHRSRWKHPVPCAVRRRRAIVRPRPRPRSRRRSPSRPRWSARRYPDENFLHLRVPFLRLWAQPAYI